MICPECRAEYREGIERCANCDVALVRELPAHEQDDAGDLVPVLKTTDPGLLPVARTVLDAAGIPYVVQGEAALSYFPLGPAAARATGRMTGASILVPRDRAEEARVLLETSPEAPDGD